MNRRFKVLLSVLAFLVTTVAIADYIKGTVRTIDYGTTNGDIRFQVNKAGTMTTVQTLQGATANTLLPDGTLANPSVVFPADSNTGIYHPGGNQVGIAADGRQAAYFTSDGTAAGSGIRVADGTTALPSYSFANDPNTGLLSDGANSIAASVGGTSVMSLSSAGLAVGNVATSSKINWKVYTGTTASFPTTLAAIPGTIIIGAIGWAQNTSTSDWGQIRYDNADTGDYLYIDAVSGTQTAISRNGAVQTYAYKVTVFYQ